jgi:ribosomal protein S18 acetylase RimI-like enzyme
MLHRSYAARMSSPSTSEYDFPYGSHEFWSAVELRQRVLREPLGLTLTVGELMQEGPPMVHYGIFEWRGEEEPQPIIACATALEISPRFWKLRQIAVAPAYQGQGFGAQVVSGMEHALRLRDAEHFCLHSRQSVQGFYEKLGYKVRGDVFEEIGLPHVLMEKTKLPLAS